MFMARLYVSIDKRYNSGIIAESISRINACPSIEKVYEDKILLAGYYNNFDDIAIIRSIILEKKIPGILEVATKFK